jgi:hypothetical protein
MSEPQRYRPNQQQPASETPSTENQPKPSTEKSIIQSENRIDVINAGRAADQHNTAEEKYWKRQVFWQATSAIATILAFITAAIYACFAHQQVAALNEATRVSNRPYVQISSANWTYTDNQPSGMELYLNNAGNTPAEQTIACGVVAGTKQDRSCQHLEMRAKQITMPGLGKHHHPYTFSEGAVIPAHQPVKVSVGGLGAEQIKRGLMDKERFSVMGAFEYTNIFDEYCCQPFQIVLGDSDSDSKLVSAPYAAYNVFCPDDRPNVCEPKSQQPPD